MTRPPLHIWIPTNRRYRDGSEKGMDGFNEIIKANRRGKDVGARQERENVKWCAWYVRQAMLDAGWEPMHDKACAIRCKVYMRFVEPNSRRDITNVYGVSKYALDALTARHKFGAAAIYDDSQRWLDPHVSMRVSVERGRAGIAITVIPMEEEQKQ